MKTIPVSELPILIVNLSTDKYLNLTYKTGWCNALIVSHNHHIRRLNNPYELELEKLPCVYEVTHLFNNNIIRNGRYLTYNYNEDEIQIVTVGDETKQNLTFEIDFKDEMYKETLVKILKTIKDDIYFFYVERIKVEI